MAQKKAMEYMWEEEKLAKDLYTRFASLYGMRIFSNISQAEGRHQGAITALLEKYELSFNENLEAGAFDNAEIQELYNQLLSKGEQGLVQALEVGREIEIKNISDLEQAIETANADSKAIFTRLLEASKRHLDAFNRHLDRS